jgi:hypothetical protein
MPLAEGFEYVEAYHFLHLDNLESVCQHGLLSCNEQQAKRVQHRSVALAGIQHRRTQMPVPVGPGGVVHDYVPFYFCKRSPMLLRVLNARNVDQQFLVYFCVPLTILEQLPCVFTDSSANRNDPPRFFDDPAQLTELNWNEINSMKWKCATESLKHRKMAELLVHRRVDVSNIPRIVVWNESFAEIARNIFDRCGIGCPQMDFDTKHYFTRYPSAPNESLVTGPFFTKQRYEETVGRVLAKINQEVHARFGSLDALRRTLRGDFAALPETAELIDLQTNNPMHEHDLATHTEQVVQRLLALPEFRGLDKTDQILTELAAYFHDMGKGPKSRWVSSGGKYSADADHPLQALPMLERILTREVGQMKRRSARLLCKLVCYHDLIGDILGKDRDERQLIEILDDARELEMLIALNKADVLVVNPGWWNEAAVRDLRERIRGHLGVE